MTKDCQQARTALDASRPERQDWREPELRTAAAHVADCPGCQEALAQRDRLDLEIGRLLARVEVPVDLESRLLAALGAVESGPTAIGETPLAADEVSPAAIDSTAAKRAGTDGAPVSRTKSGRRWRSWAVVAAAMLVAFGIGWWRFPAGQLLSMDLVSAELSTLVPGNAAGGGSVPFDGGFDAQVTDGVWQEAIGRSAPRGLNLDGQPGHDAAAYRFASGRVSGWLVVLPRARVIDPPAAAAPLRSQARYLPQPEVAWTSGDQVYLCVLDRGSLDDLLREMYGGTA